MPNPEQPKYKISVYLIKKEYGSFEDVIDSVKVTDHYTLKEEFNINGIVYTGHNDSNQPDWNILLQQGANNMPNLYNQSTRAILLVKRENRIFAFTFGHGKHLMLPESYERGFGLRVVLNNANPEKLKSLDASIIDDLIIQSRTQASKSTEIQSFDVDNYRDFLRSVTAEAIDKDRYGEILSGRDSFHYNGYFNFHDLSQLCSRLLADYNSNKYQKTPFYWIDYIKNITDPQTVQKLDGKLVDGIMDSDKTIHLAPPYILNYEENYTYSYTENGQKFQDLNMKDLINNKFNFLNNLDADKLKRHKIFCWTHGDSYPQESWSIYQCCVAEIEFDNKTYILTFGQWFEVDNGFEESITDYIKKIPNSKLPLDSFDPEKGDVNEESYNKRMGEEDYFICLDRKNIQIDNSKIEVCDLLSKEGELIHVKPWSSSSTLSHLFSQGRISADLLSSNYDAREKTINKINQIDSEYSNLIKKDNFITNNYKVVFAIIYKENKPIEERLPFFSKLNFMHTHKQLINMQFNVEKIHIRKLSTDS
ncbi:DUF6119 family protein [Aquibacillus sediminis]|uniref:DUF6119 family protein n=1 Tax=Aquibacillus sediminis TaxID=2574734 RepID=UPI0014871978|nr:TIGR04141 family sporadically distributed protein [Aquibacillus sediminis]